eukprot:5115620-Amphidinium_carterae.1
MECGTVRDNDYKRHENYKRNSKGGSPRANHARMAVLTFASFAGQQTTRLQTARRWGELV